MPNYTLLVARMNSASGSKYQNMSKVRQKIKVNKFEVVIVNYEEQERLVISVVDKTGAIVGRLNVSNHANEMQLAVNVLPSNMN